MRFDGLTPGALYEYEIVQYFNVSVFAEWPAIGPSV
jgi:hypothetical protein